ncbi:MAG TPA: winged helix DNA-binding domain-containing protein [Gemmatimonadaceae bacterium]|nr:winged helix DNA-binding domain-containing protein [Gemmatimonadaceae bacterium]
MPPTTLSLRALNRATLARQMLLERHACTPLDALERLMGLQAQVARPPFLGLWTRLRGFERAQLLALAAGRQAVRATMMRGTLHLVTAADYLRFRMPLQPMLTAAMRSVSRGDGAFALEPVLRAARTLLAEGPRTFDEIRAHLAVHIPEANERLMGYAVRVQLPLVMVPTAGAWGWDPKSEFALADAWLGIAPHEDASPHALVRRYLAAFGPATPADASAWSGLRGLRPVFETLRPELVVFRDEAGRELFDLPDAPRPDPDASAPVRFLPDFDNLVLAHDDRARVLAPEHRARIVSKNLIVAPTFLVDGRVAGTWRITRSRGTAVLTLNPFGALGRRLRGELEEEGTALLRFVEEGAKVYEVREEE